VLVLTAWDTTPTRCQRSRPAPPGTCSRTRRRRSCSTRSARRRKAVPSVLSPAVASRLVTAVRNPAPAPLAARERQVLQLVAKGTSNRDIARELFISEATVKTHLSHVSTKLGVTDRAAAVAKGYDQGILGRD
jgi:DNA-binding NarL/FixJ family response regulator